MLERLITLFETLKADMDKTDLTFAGWRVWTAELVAESPREICAIEPVPMLIVEKPTTIEGLAQITRIIMPMVGDVFTTLITATLQNEELIELWMPGNIVFVNGELVYDRGTQVLECLRKMQKGALDADRN